MDGTLVLSLPDAVSPIVWRMPKERLQTASFQVRADEDSGHYTLVTITDDGQTHDIAAYENKSEAVTALMTASAAFENAGKDRPASAQPAAQTDIQAERQSVHTPGVTAQKPPTKSGRSGVIAFFAVLLLLVAGLVYINMTTDLPSERTVSAPGAGDTGTFNSDVVAPHDGDHVYGNEDAPITLIEYSDLECPHCKRFHPIVRDLVDRSNGQINWIYRHAPLHGSHSYMEGVATECAAELGGNEAFWSYTGAIFSRTDSGGEGFSLKKLVPLAGEIGLDRKEFHDCVKRDKYKSKLEKHLQQAQDIQIRGTPGIVLYNNKTGKSKILSGLHKSPRLNAEIRGLKQ